jgi:hypothetical protein
MFGPPTSVFLCFSPQLDNIMNVVPHVTGPRVAGKNHADKTFFNRNRVTDFELRFVPAACDGSMWCLLHLSHCDAPGAARTCPVETERA